MTSRRGTRKGTLVEVRAVDGAVSRFGRLRLADGSKSGRIPVPESKTRSEALRWLASLQKREDAQGIVYRAKLERERELAARRGETHPSESTDAWFTRYVASKACGEGHRAKTQSQWKKWISPILGAKPVATLTRDDLEEVRDHLDRASARGAVRAKTCASVWGHLTSAMKAAANAKDRSLRVHAVAPGSVGLHAGILPPDTGASRKRVWIFPVEFEALMHCEDVPLAARRLYAVAAYTGLRPGELRVLRWSAIDFDARTLTVSQAWDDTTKKVKAPKTDAGRRTFPLVASLVPLLEVLRGAPNELVVPALARNEERIAQKFRAHLAAAGVKRPRLYTTTDTEEAVDFRSLRDAHATWQALAGLSPMVLQRRLGHVSHTTTAGYCKQAEDVSGGAIGEPFGPLDVLLVDKLLDNKTENPSFHRGFLVARVGFESMADRQDTKFLEDSNGATSETPPEECQVVHGSTRCPDKVSDPLAAAFLAALRPVLAAAVRAELERRRASK